MTEVQSTGKQTSGLWGQGGSNEWQQWCVIPATSLRKPLPANILAVKQTFNKHLSALWQWQFKLSPYKSTRRESNRTSRKMPRCWAGDNPVCWFTFALCISNLMLIYTAFTNWRPCLNCSLQNKHIPETVKHFIFECSAYAKECFWMRGKLGRGAFSLRELLTKQKHMKILLNYVGKAKWLKKIFGDVTFSKPVQNTWSTRSHRSITNQAQLNQEHLDRLIPNNGTCTGSTEIKRSKIPWHWLILLTTLDPYSSHFPTCPFA